MHLRKISNHSTFLYWKRLSRLIYFVFNLRCYDIQDFVYDGTMFYYLPAKFQITAFLKVGMRCEEESLINSVLAMYEQETNQNLLMQVGYHGEDTCRSNDQDTNLRGQNQRIEIRSIGKVLKMGRMSVLRGNNEIAFRVPREMFAGSATMKV